MIYTANCNHPEIRCAKCGSTWFQIMGFARVMLHYDAEARRFLNDILVDESAPLVASAVACMDCGYDCTVLAGDTFGPIFQSTCADRFERDTTVALEQPKTDCIQHVTSTKS
jgi:hypothetical protein